MLQGTPGSAPGITGGASVACAAPPTVPRSPAPRAPRAGATTTRAATAPRTIPPATSRTLQSPLAPRTTSCWRGGAPLPPPACHSLSPAPSPREAGLRGWQGPPGFGAWLHCRSAPSALRPPRFSEPRLCSQLMLLAMRLEQGQRAVPAAIAAAAAVAVAALASTTAIRFDQRHDGQPHHHPRRHRLPLPDVCRGGAWLLVACPCDAVVAHELCNRQGGGVGSCHPLQAGWRQPRFA